MITFALNTCYEFIFKGNTVNNTLYEIKLSIVYGVKSDWILTYNCPKDLPIEIINSNEIIYKVDSDTLNSFALSEYSCTFIDEQLILMYLIESNNVNISNFVIEIKVNNECLFIGCIDLMSVSFNKKENQLQCDFKPRSYILNQTDTVINGAINYSVLNITSNQIPLNIIDFITRIYRLVNPDIQLNISADFDFFSVNSNVTPPIVTVTNINEIYVDERIFGSYNGANFVFNDIDNFGTLIKRIAFTFGCITGLVSDNKAIFYPFLSNNKPCKIINSESVINYNIEGVRDKIDCLKISPSGIYAGSYTEISGKYIVKDIFNLFLQNTNNGFIQVSKLGLNNQIYNFDEAILNYYKDYYMSKKYCFEHIFELLGIDFDPYTDIEVFGKRFTPIEISINFEKFTTKIKAVSV